MRSETLQFKKFIETKGLLFTPERRSVAEELFSSHDHLDAEEVLKKLRSSGSKASRATVYRTLDLLVESGLVEKIDLGEGRSAYEHTAGHPHHDHLVCMTCGKVQEFEEPLIEQLQEWACEKAGFRALGHSLNIYGLCAECKTSTKQ